MDFGIRSYVFPFAFFLLGTGGCSPETNIYENHPKIDSTSAEVLQTTCPSDGPPVLGDYKILASSIYLDLPDPIISRVTSALEDTYIRKLVKGDIRSPLVKTYCQIGLGRFVVDMTYPVEDDAISHMTERAIYIWVADAELSGWQISELGQKSICVREIDPKTKLCQ